MTNSFNFANAFNFISRYLLPAMKLAQCGAENNQSCPAYVSLNVLLEDHEKLDILNRAVQNGFNLDECPGNTRDFALVIEYFDDKDKVYQKDYQSDYSKWTAHFMITDYRLESNAIEILNSADTRVAAEELYIKILQNIEEMGAETW